MVDVILSDRELYNDLKMLTEQNRENIYYDIYLTFVNLRKKKTINGIRFIIRTRDYHVPDATGRQF